MFHISFAELTQLRNSMALFLSNIFTITNLVFLEIHWGFCTNIFLPADEFTTIWEQDAESDQTAW